MTNVEIPEVLQKTFEFIDENKENCIHKLREAVSVHSVSCEASRKEDLFTMAYWFAAELRYIGVTVEMVYPGLQSLRESTKVIEIPPVILGQIGDDPKKKTVLLLSHYDVHPAYKDEGWDTDPFTLVAKGEQLIGRGVADIKGPLIAWICAVEAYLHVNKSLPVNVKFIIEGMTEVGRIGLDRIFQDKKSFLRDTNFICDLDSYQISKYTPSIVYANRGVLLFIIEIECCKTDLHSGFYGGTVIEAMPDLAYMLDGLIGENGIILIPGIYDDVEPVTREEEMSYKKIDFDIDKYKRQLGCTDLLFHTKKNLLMNRWRFPILTIHGIEGAFSEAGEKTVIPGCVRGKISIRIVPNQHSTKIAKLVVNYFEQKWKQRDSPNKYKLHIDLMEDPWITTYDNHNYRAGFVATQMIYNVKPNLIRQGNTVLYLAELEKLSTASLISLPLVSSDDAPHSQNESINSKDLINSVKLVAAYLYNLSLDELILVEKMN